MPTEGRRAPADVDGHVNDGTAQYPHQFSLREWLGLEVQAAQDAFGARERVIVLDELRVDARFSIGAAVVDLGEETALVAGDRRRDDLHVGDSERLHMERHLRGPRMML